jgi:hypothetical protein
LSSLGAKPKDKAGPTIDDSSITDAQDVVRRTIAVFIAGTAAMLRAGQGLGQAMVRGFQTGASGMAAVGVAAGVAAALGAARASGAMYAAGSNLGAALASGIGSQVGRAAAAAVALAVAAVLAARRVLQISSPSKVFLNIGRDIGRGFIQGIKDSEGDMASALTEAIDNAITKANETARSRRAEVGVALFDIMTPAAIAGGTSQLEVQQLTAAINQAIGSFTQALQDAAAGTFGEGAGGVFAGWFGAASAEFDFINALRDVAAQYREAVEQQKEIAEFDKKKAELDAKLASGSISKAEYDRQLKELGERPTSLTFDQRSLLATGPGGLNPASVAGQANIQALQTALETIRSYGQAMIEAGVPVGDVVAKVREYVATIVEEAAARGLNVAAVRDLVDMLGLSNADLAAFQEQLLSLNIADLAGSANVQNINEQLQAIRDYARELLAAGTKPDAVAAAVRRLRNQLVAAAREFGFNAAQLAQLVEAAGLSDSALRDFIAQLRDFEDEARNANQAAQQAARDAAAAGNATDTPGALPRPFIENLYVTTPYGDPEAIGLAVLNQAAYDGLTSGS